MYILYRRGVCSLALLVKFYPIPHLDKQRECLQAVEKFVPQDWQRDEKIQTVPLFFSTKKNLTISFVDKWLKVTAKEELPSEWVAVH